MTSTANFKNMIAGWLEDDDVSNSPCDGLDGNACGAVGATRNYVDYHVFTLCPECAWLLTEQYHANGSIAPWESQDDPGVPG
jgi:hypothetical protein